MNKRLPIVVRSENHGSFVIVPARFTRGFRPLIGKRFPKALAAQFTMTAEDGPWRVVRVFSSYEAEVIEMLFHMDEVLRPEDMGRTPIAMMETLMDDGARMGRFKTDS